MWNTDDVTITTESVVETDRNKYWAENTSRTAVCATCGFRIELNTDKADLDTLDEMLGCCDYPDLVYED